MGWFITDVEADGPVPGLASMTAVALVYFAPGYPNHRSSYCTWVTPEIVGVDAAHPASNRAKAEREGIPALLAMQQIEAFAQGVNSHGIPVIVSDNPAFDFPYVNYNMHKHLANPSGGGQALG